MKVQRAVGLFAVLLMLFPGPDALGQRLYSTQDVHSHNDYAQKIPFYAAIAREFGSMEADVFLIHGDLLVAHSLSAVTPERTLRKMYVLPLVEQFKKNNNKPYPSPSKRLQLLIDIKQTGSGSVREVVKETSLYPGVFDRRVNKLAVQVIITGNRPRPDSFYHYPPNILFDYALEEKLDAAQLARVGLVSLDYHTYCHWNGVGEFTASDEHILKHLIDTAHHLGKKIRFYGAPDNPLAWKVFMQLGADYLNTDHIDQIADFLEEKTPR